ncbi:MAG TPA: rRNA maturation RNase YbeY [Hyphomicrobiaceae bacterium]|nr:rRNA maturation RNase YbeY [Hyphomicrobiaceae bacterium]
MTRPDGQRPGAALAIEIVEESGNWAVVPEAGALIAQATDALARHPAIAGRLPAAATIVLASDADVQVLNRTWRGKDKPTNVLSFPAGTGARDEDGRPLLGDVVLAIESIQLEAHELAVPVAHHLQHLVVHGTLHLMGYDHETDADAEVMEGLEVAVLQGLGVPNPYDD